MQNLEDITPSYDSLEVDPNEDESIYNTVTKIADIVEPGHEYIMQNGATQYRRDERVLSQGWKIHIAAEVEEAFEVTKATIPYLLEENQQHKLFCLDKLERLDENKFITVYPSVDEDKKDAVIEDGLQVFKYKSPEFNRKSINANKKTAERLIEELAKVLNHSDILYGGPEIRGKHGEETQWEGTRIHYRNGILNSDKIPRVEDCDEILTKYDLIGPNGKVDLFRSELNEIASLDEPSLELS